MKRSFSLLLTLLLLISVSVFSAQPTLAASNRPGDIDNDGYVTVADARICLRFCVSLCDLSLYDQYAADIDGNGYVSTGEAREILRFAVGLTSEYIKQHPVDVKPQTPTKPSDLPEDAKILYMTFDDGPSKYTDDILDILDQYGAKATFFVMYQPDYSHMYKEIVDRGHAIALHTYSHDYASIYSSDAAYFRDLQKISDYVYNQTGVRTNLIRFPGGGSNTISRSYNYGIMSRLTREVENRGYVYFDWNASNEDANGRAMSWQQIRDAAIGYRQQEIVMLMHDTNAKYTTVQALPSIIEHYQARGYHCLALTEDSETAHHGVNN